MTSKILKKVISDSMFKKTIEQAIKESKNRSWVLDQIEPLIESIDDCTEQGGLIFDKLADRIDFLIER